MVEQRAASQEGLVFADTDIGVLIALGRGAGPEGPLDLWALQSGVRPAAATCCWPPGLEQRR